MIEAGNDKAYLCIHSVRFLNERCGKFNRRFFQPSAVGPLGVPELDRRSGQIQNNSDSIRCWRSAIKAHQFASSG